LKGEKSNQSWEKKIAQCKVSEKIAKQGGELGVEVAKDHWHRREYHNTA